MTFRMLAVIVGIILILTMIGHILHGVECAITPYQYGC